MGNELLSPKIEMFSSSLPREVAQDLTCLDGWCLSLAYSPYLWLAERPSPELITRLFTSGGQLHVMRYGGKYLHGYFWSELIDSTLYVTPCPGPYPSAGVSADSLVREVMAVAKLNGARSVIIWLGLGTSELARLIYDSVSAPKWLFKSHNVLHIDFPVRAEVPEGYDLIYGGYGMIPDAVSVLREAFGEWLSKDIVEKLSVPGSFRVGMLRNIESDEIAAASVGHVSPTLDGGRTGFIDYVGVRPAKRGKGLGKALTSLMTSAMLGEGAGHVVITCGTELVKHYVELGYRAVGNVSSLLVKVAY